MGRRFESCRVRGDLLRAIRVGPALSSISVSAKAKETPGRLVAKELTSLRSLFRETNAAYIARIEGEIEQIRDLIVTTATRPTRAQTHSLREMLGLIRQLSIRPEKGRRKDMKKIDSLISELRLLIDDWQQ